MASTTVGRTGNENEPDDIYDGEPVIINGDGSLSPDTSESGIPVIEPATIVAPEENGNGKRRGRPRGSKNTSRQPTQKEVRQDLTGLLLSVHLMGAALLKTPELALDEDEAKQLGEAVARVNREFGVQIMSPKMAALLNLTIVAGTVYGPRAVAIYHNKKNAQKKGKVNGSVQNVDATDDLFTGGATAHPVI